jgi:chromosome segregation ATPase
MRNNDLAKTLAQAENTLRTRDGQIAMATKEIKNIDFENGSLNDVNSQLDEDLEACQRHLENLTLQNSTLLAELERYSAEDEGVRGFD